MVVWELGGEEIQHEVGGMFLTEVLAENVYCELATGFCDTTRKPLTSAGPTWALRSQNYVLRCYNMALSNL